MSGMGFDIEGLSKCPGDDNNYRGWVSTSDQALQVKKNFEIQSGVNFIRLSDYNSNQARQQDGLMMKPREIRFTDATGVIYGNIHPFITVRTDTYVCMFGPERHGARIQRETMEKEKRFMEDHPVPMKRAYKKRQPSRKKGCSAKLIIKEVVLCTGFKMERNTDYERKLISKSIHACLDKQQELQKETRVYIKFPEEEKHRSVHKLGKLTGLLRPLSKDVSAKINQLVGLGVGRVGEMRRHLRIFVENELFPDPSNRPSTWDTGYFPSDECIAQHIYSAKMSMRYSKVDQDNLQKQVEEWQFQNPEDRFFIQLPTKPPQEGSFVIEDDEVLPSSSSPDEFFFCHQTKFQRHLLSRYGNEMTFLDATYKTSHYALPLFFVAVKTNVGYSVVAQFVVQSETREVIVKGLKMISEWMAEDQLKWEPSAFMTDFSEREIYAIEEVFPAAKVFLCDFHREQAWVRWIRKKDNGVGSAEENVLSLLRNCAHVLSREDLDKAVTKLKSSTPWTENPKLRRWFDTTWLPHVERWSWSYRTDGLPAFTNNGLERQNRVFKEKFLNAKGDFSLSGMTAALIIDFIPSAMRRYIMANVKADAAYGRSYNDGIPPFLWNRPPAFVQHCMARIEKAEVLERKDIQLVEDDIFHVRLKN
eukprot:XP_011669699.1 PREDICTED: uncharacterized protein LOC105440834 [Strongylocentrotus purpuratus]